LKGDNRQCRNPDYEVDGYRRISARSLTFKRPLSEVKQWFEQPLTRPKYAPYSIDEAPNAKHGEYRKAPPRHVDLLP
jgi:hypothetical protein